MSSARKRLYKEVDKLQEVESPGSSKVIHGLLTCVSPMKKGKYFDGRIADESRCLRLVGFDAGKQEQLETKYSKNEPVALENCEIKESKYGEGMEIVVSKATRVLPSLRKFDRDEILKTSVAPLIDINELSQYADYNLVTILVKILAVEDRVEVKPNLWKQEVIVADKSASTKITLWQSDIGKLELNQSYLINNITVTSFRGIKSLSVSYSSSIEVKDDIGEVVEPVEESKEKLKGVHVMGVSIETNKTFICIKCDSRVQPIQLLEDV